MVTKINYVSEEFETLCNRKQRKCGKFMVARIVAISVIVFIVLIVSIIYHGIVLERMDKLRQIMLLNAEHQEQHKNPIDTEYKLQTKLKLSSNELETINAHIENGNFEESLKMKHKQIKYFRHRIPRDLAALIDPIDLTRNELNFQKLYAKVRSKRAQIALHKLEKEYVRCKKESMSGNECMVAFVKMYNIAKDISEKMEKMKAIFKDSEMLLQLKSDSNSNETEEKWKDKKDEQKPGGLNPVEDLNKTVLFTTTTTTIEATTGELIATTTELIKTTAAETTTTPKPLRPIKIKPMKFSWIIDGNDDEDEFHLLSLEETKTETTATMTSKASTSTQTTLATTIQDLTIEDSTSRTPSATELPEVVSIKEVITTASPSDGSKSFDSMAATATTKYTEDRDIIATTEVTSTKDVNSDDIKLHKLKFDYIIGDDELTAEIADESSTTLSYHTTTPSTKPTTATTPDVSKLIKYQWIIDSGVISAEENSTSKTTVSERNRSVETEDNNTAAEIIVENSTKETTLEHKNKTITLLATSQNNNSQMRFDTATSHPLDNPSSIENMLESSEHHEGKHLKPIIYSSYTVVRNKTEPVDSTTAGPLIDPYSSKEWEKTFQKASGAALRPQEELIDSFGELDAKSIAKFGPKLNPTNTQGLGNSDIQFRTLCERISKNLRNKGSSSGILAPIPEPDSENFTQSPSAHFTSRGPGGFPVTGETMKASAQFMYNPNFGMPTIPICFFVTPASFRMMNQGPMWTPSYLGMSGNYGGSSGTLMGSGGPGGIFFVPQNFGTTGNNFGHSSGTAGGSQGNIPNIFSKNATPQNQHQQQKQFFCTYMQNQQNNYNNGAQQGVGGSAPGNGVNGIGFSNANFKMRHSNQSSPTDIVYASYAGLPEHLGDADQFRCVLPDQTACYGGHECIDTDSWCDGRVDCSDGSDEAACTCRNRLLEERLCDGYPDCPMGEDEIGCFGCAEFMYSCYNSVEQYEHHNRSSVSMCYSNIEKCDGFDNCLNGQDETECSIIVNDLSNHMSHSVSSSEGFLYHNYRGEWFPVCNNGEKWALEACESEYGTSGVPNVTYQAQSLPGPFIEPSLQGSAHFPQSCQKREGHDELIDHVSYVKCAPAKCGITQLNSKQSQQRYRSKRYVKLQEARKKRETKQEIVRIVGGSQSKPKQWPFVVALYRNGNFHCGGAIYTENWVISAAHCMINYQKYYYEVRAGVLRRSSYSASTQIQPVSHIMVHQAYERRTMRNDLSLLRLSEPLKINRWVKPICLPDLGRTTKHNDWVWGPEENTICYAVGWGAIREKGPGSDHLREVSLPIRKRCKEKEDREAEDVCAGDADGGRDACQGDSGGPLFCRSVSNNQEWYLAGVVSHGNGCARAGEFGVYTRVALYVDWIQMAVRPEYLPLKQPLHLCPGFVCIWGGQRCISQRKRCDRVVDCLGGEDEVGCIYNFIPDVSSVKNSTTESDYYPENAATTALNTEGSNVTLADNLVGVTAASISGHNIDEGTTALKNLEIPNTTVQHFNDTQEISTSQHDISSSSTVKPLRTQSVLTTEFMSTTQSPSRIQSASTTQSPSTIQSSSSTQSALTSQSQSTTQSPSTTESPSTTQSSSMTESTSMSESTPQSTSTTQSPQSDETSVLTTSFPSSTEDLQRLVDLTTKILASITEGIEKLDNFSTVVVTAPFATKTTTPIDTTAAEVVTKVMDSITDAIVTTTFSTAGTTESSTFAYKVGTLSPSINTRPQAQVPQKFVCKKISQIIDAKHRCDRTVDCEDATDEDDCNCRDFLKGQLSALICDGKPDCDDLTDEEDCDNCAASEFLCPLSKTCLPLHKRCDNVIDCKYKEDEQDCFALTNGNDIVLDLNKQPVLSNVGIFSRNIRGIWRIVCSHETGFHQHSKKTATEVCSLLGFRGYKFFNTTAFRGIDDFVPIDPVITKKSRLSSHFSAIAGDNDDFSSVETKFLPHPKHLGTEHIEEGEEECFGLYLECNAKSNKKEPFKTLSAGSEITPPSLESHKLEPIMMANGRPNVFVKPHTPTVVVSKKEELLDKLDQVIESKKNLTVMIHDKLHVALEELHWPWLVDIYANGRLWCIGVLIDKHWVMVHESCNFGLRLQIDYVVALFGGGKTRNNFHKSPNEALRRVDCYEVVTGSDVLIFHLEQPVHFSHHILPIFLPISPDENLNMPFECLAVVHDDETGRIKTLAIAEHKNDTTCVKSTGLSCYKLIEQQPPYELLEKSQISQEDLYSISDEIVLKSDSDENIKNSSMLSPFTTCKRFGNKNARSDSMDPIDQAILVCRSNDTGWYPKALFSYNNSDCSSFKQPFAIRTLEHVYKTIEDQIDKPKCSFSYAAAPCSTWRCPLGLCLEPEQICDLHNDCHDGSDEEPSMCLERKKACKPSEMKCRSSNKCIPKTKFCDHVPDCDDLTDEPTVCSCFTYLQATDPGKICDGIRNCWDKSDESPVLCNCTESLFACGRNSNECIPQDFVCDKESDCPNGEDEKYCYGIEHPIENSHKQDNWKTDVTRLPFYGQVIEQTYGIWHTKCFPRSSPPDIAEIRQICRKLGYSPYRQPSYRLIDDVDNKVVETNIRSDPRSRSFSNESLVGRYRDATKAKILSKFSPLQLNEELTLFLKPSRPIAELVRWNATDSSNCFRLEIKCA